MPGKAGFNCVLTAGGQTIGKARDVEMPMTADVIDTTVRDVAPWRDKIQGLKTWTSTVDQLWVPTDTGLQTLRDAFLNGTQIACTYLDEDGYGFSGNAIVTGLTFSQALEDAVFLNVTLEGVGAVAVVEPTT